VAQVTQAADGPPGAARTATPLSGTRPSSARALLLVVLGEFVWPTRAPAWSSTLLSALAELDVEPNAARKALHRTAESGITEPGRVGRRVHWSITAKGALIMSSGHERTYNWDARRTSWDGTWLLLSVSVPETQRKLRHHLQNRLTWAGMGSPVPGQWITTHWERADEVAQIVRDLGLEEQAHSFVGTLGPLGSEAGIVGAAWDLDALADDYRSFIETYAETHPHTDAECFRARVLLVQDWRRFPYLDPDLPRRFLPAGWPGYEAVRLFRDRHGAWVSRSATHWDHLDAQE